jgi:hypothetical protein
MVVVRTGRVANRYGWLDLPRCHDLTLCSAASERCNMHGLKHSRTGAGASGSASIEEVDFPPLVVVSVVR